MKLRILALDYDGTIAVEGVLDPAVRRAIKRARDRGLSVLLVTGRRLGDLRRLLGDLAAFDAVVAENGAVLALPQVGRVTRLAPPPPPAFLSALRQRGLQPRLGMCVVELPASAAHVALDLIVRLELPLVALFNRSQLMILPQAVSKATGLREALRVMRLSPHNAVALGDAENDHELLAACEMGVAVAWGSTALQQVADSVLPGTGPAAVADYIDRLLERERVVLPARVRRTLRLGRDRDGEVVALAVRGRNVLVAGDPRSGKSWVAGLLCEQLLLQHYTVCVLDPEGDYAELEGLPGVHWLGGEEPPPAVPAIVRMLRHGETSLVVDLSSLPLDKKRAYVAAALPALAELRRQSGLPHRIVLDEAHYFLHDAARAADLDRTLAGYTLVTCHVSALHRSVVDLAECVVLTRVTDANESALLHARFGAEVGLGEWQAALAGLPADEATLLPSAAEAGGRLRCFRLAPRLTRHVRHRTKYLDVPVSDALAFKIAAGDGASTVLHSLQDLIEALQVTPCHALAEHVRRGDFSRWIEDVFRDSALANEIRSLEDRCRRGSLRDFNPAVIRAVHHRYHVTDDLT